MSSLADSIAGLVAFRTGRKDDDAVDRLVGELACARADFSEQLAAVRAEFDAEVDRLHAELAEAYDELRRLYAIEAFRRLAIERPTSQLVN